MTTKKLIATTAMAALAVPAAAVADKPENAGSKGKTKSAQAKAKTKGKGFSVKGVDLSGLTITDGKLAGALTLDPTSANKHARKLLDLTKAEIKGEDTVQLGTAGDAVIIKLNGLSTGDPIQATDRVKVIGKVAGTTLDIRKITITRGETESATTTTASKTSTRKSPAEQCEGKSRKKAEGETKSAYSKCVSAAAKAQNDDSDSDSDSDSDKS